MKKTKHASMVKIIFAILMVLVLISCANPVFADPTVSEPTVKPGDLTGDYAETDDIGRIGQTVVGILTTIGIVISVIVLIILGIKYMIGSASEKAEYKKTMIPYLIGAILVFAASSIASIVMNVSGSFKKPEEGAQASYVAEAFTETSDNIIL